MKLISFICHLFIYSIYNIINNFNYINYINYIIKFFLGIYDSILLSNERNEKDRQF